MPALLLPVLCLLAAAGEAPPAAPSMELSVSCDPNAHRIDGTAVFILADLGLDGPVFDLHPSLAVREVFVDGRAAPSEMMLARDQAAKTRLRVVLPEPLRGTHRISLRYDGVIHDPPRVAQFSREHIADQTEGTIQAEGVFLSPSSAWYPRIHRVPLATFRLEVRMPPGWDAVSEGSLKARDEGPGQIRVVYEGRWPQEGIDLVGGRWKRFEDSQDGVTVAAYVYPEDVDLAAPYQQAVRRYLKTYGAWIGPYAYDRFSVVENFFPTGYGMPGFTLLGKEVMRLPFIVSTSLGHEVAHDWWGNGVFVDETGGNWCEGLTTYVADYHYKETESAQAAAEYRREACRDYTNYVSEPGRDFALSQFTERSTPATRAIGYGKTMMVFHMLERRIGKTGFDAVLRRVYRENLFKAASWDTWKKAFSAQAGEDLGWFFDQWVQRPGAPTLAVEGVSVREVRGGDPREFEVTGHLTQSGDPFRLRVPLVLEAGDRAERRTVDVDGASARFAVRAPFKPEILRVDPGQEVFRRLDPREMPPVLSRVLGDPKTLFVVDDTADPGLVGAYREIATTLTRTGEGKMIDASRVKPEDLADRSVFLLGLPEAPLLKGLLAELPAEVSVAKSGFTIEAAVYEQPGAAVLAVGRRPGDPTRSVAVFAGLTPNGALLAGRKLLHYGKYSFLAFVDGTNKAKGVSRVTGGPLIVRF